MKYMRDPPPGCFSDDFWRFPVDCLHSAALYKKTGPFASSYILSLISRLFPVSETVVDCELETVFFRRYAYGFEYDVYTSLPRPCC